MGDTDRRWYDSSKVIWGLFGMIGIIVLGCASIVWGMAMGAKDGTAENRGEIRELRARVEDHTKQLDRIESNVSQILLEVKKR